MRESRDKQLVVVGAVLLALMFGLVAWNSVPWIGRTFPGFMIMANRVVPSIALPHWSEGRAPELFQEQVISVDGVPVDTSGDVYDIVAAKDPGAPVAY